MHDVFLSPAAFLSAVKQKKKHCLQKANATKNLKNPRKALEIPGRHGKSREGMVNPGKAWEILGKHGKYWEGMGNPSKA